MQIGTDWQVPSADPGWGSDASAEEEQDRKVFVINVRTGEVVHEGLQVDELDDEKAVVVTDSGHERVELTSGPDRTLAALIPPQPPSDGSPGMSLVSVALCPEMVCMSVIKFEPSGEKYVRRIVWCG